MVTGPKQLRRPKRKQIAGNVRVDEHSLLASICKSSLYETVREFWYEIIQDDPIWNWHIEYLCNELQEIGERVIRREPRKYDLIINIPPGTTKSTVCTVVFPMWLWMNDPTIQAICGSFSADLATALGSLSRDIVQSEKFRRAFPDIVLRDDTEAKRFFKNTKGGWRRSTGTGAMITGFHGHVIIVDDPLDPNDAYSDAEMDTANKWMTDVIPKRKIDKKVTPIILIMQRLAEDDPTGHWMTRVEGNRLSKVRHICLPAEKTDKIRPLKLRKKYKQKLLDPKRLSQEVLDEAKLEGLLTFEAQYNQDPQPPGASMFRVDQIEIVDEPPAEDEVRRVVRYWDKAGTAGGGAFTVGLKMSWTYSGLFYIEDVERGQWSVDKRERKIKECAEQDGTDCRIYVEQEPGSGGKESAQYTIRRLHGYKAEADPPKGNKVFRAEPFAAQANVGNVKLVRGPWNKVFLHEAGFFPNSKFKDQIDAGSGAFSKVSNRGGSLRDWAKVIGATDSQGNARSTGRGNGEQEQEGNVIYGSL